MGTLNAPGKNGENYQPTDEDIEGFVAYITPAEDEEGLGLQYGDEHLSIADMIRHAREKTTIGIFLVQGYLDIKRRDAILEAEQAKTNPLTRLAQRMRDIIAEKLRAVGVF